MHIIVCFKRKRMEGYRENDPHFATKALHVGQEPEQWNRSLTLSYPLSTFFHVVIVII
jgi:hypothetical protein